MNNFLPGGRTFQRPCHGFTSAFLAAIVFLLVPGSAVSQSDAATSQFEKATEAMRVGNLDAAASGFAAVVRQAPAFAEAHFNLGLVNEERGRYEEAIASLEKAIALKPHLHGANLFLGITEFRLNHLDKARLAVARETASYPKDASAWMWLGVVCLAQDKAEDAADALDRAAKLNPNDQDIFYHRGRAHLLVSKNSYAHMFKLNSQSWLVHRVLAQANSEAERHTDAITEYELAIKLAPAQPGLHEELGSEYRAVNKIDEAEAEFKTELEIDPHNVLAKYKLGAIAVEKGDGAKGKELIEEAQREKPDLVHLDYNLGRSEMLLGNDEAATSHFERTVKTDTDPDVVEQAWYQLGTAYRRLHRMDEARAAIATYQQLKDEAAKKSQEKLERFRVDHPNPSDATPPTQNPQ
ncbi:MAG TPA: tetratricopeptide repeat protein [Candidatus Dormibacteraeota bacterium]|nr:tetratricopeptide repeat protein [Candidatus Dormibacteraeota bacterium]